jgi:hypothetical protein
MPLTYIYHIGFVLETEASILIYDSRLGILIYVWQDGCLLFITSLNFVWMPIALMHYRLNRVFMKEQVLQAMCEAENVSYNEFGGKPE